MSVFADDQPAQTSWPGSHHAELVTAGSPCESVYQVAAIYTAIMSFFMKYAGTEHAWGSCTSITLD